MTTQYWVISHFTDFIT